MNRLGPQDTGPQGRPSDVQLCDAGGDPEGSLDGGTAHVRGRRHLGVAVLVRHVEQGWILPRRAFGRSFFPGAWSVSSWSHVRPGRTPEAAARHGVEEELGCRITGLEPCGRFTHRAIDPRSGLIEHEHVHVFVALTSDDPRPDPARVAELATVDTLERAHHWLRHDGAPGAARAVDLARRHRVHVDGRAPVGPGHPGADRDGGVPVVITQRPRDRTEVVSRYTIFAGETPSGFLISHGLYGTFDLIPRALHEILFANRVRGHAPRFGRWSSEVTADDGCAGRDRGGEVGSGRSLETITDEDRAFLRRRGYLVGAGTDELGAFTAYSKQLHERRRHDLVFVVMPAYDCNLRCDYCFQDHLRHDPHYRHILEPMTVERADLTVRAMADIARRAGFDPDRHHRSVGLFGGEPLSARTEVAVRYLVARLADEQGIALWAVTNGTDLKRFSDLLGPDRIAGLQISVDGPRDEHDRRRVGADGRGSYDRIVSGIERAISRDCRVDLRVTVDARNLGSLTRLLDDVEARGWLASPLFTVNVAPLHPGGPGADSDLMIGHLGLSRGLDAAVDPRLARLGTVDRDLRDQIHTVLATGDSPDRSGQFCAAASSMYVFDPVGDVYACWERTAAPATRIGFVTPDGRYRANLHQELHWRNRLVGTHPVCRRCPYALWCGGGCASQAEIGTGHADSHLCQGYAGRFNRAARDAVARLVAGVPAPGPARPPACS
ncbi:MAG: radical SAM protein [Acidimicrobiales bacterium]